MHHQETLTQPRPYNGQTGAIICGSLALILVGVIATMATHESASGDRALSPITTVLVVGLVHALLLIAFIVLSTRSAQGGIFRRLASLEAEHRHWQEQQQAQLAALVDEFAGRFEAHEQRLQALLGEVYAQGAVDTMMGRNTGRLRPVN